MVMTCHKNQSPQISQSETPTSVRPPRLPPQHHARKDSLRIRHHPPSQNLKIIILIINMLNYI